MSHEAEYRVDFSSKAGNLVYKDSIGVLHFIFEVDSSVKPTVIFLERVPLTRDFKMIELSALPQAEQSRIKLAGERVEQFLISTGAQVRDLPTLSDLRESF